MFCSESVVLVAVVVSGVDPIAAAALFFAAGAASFVVGFGGSTKLLHCHNDCYYQCSLPFASGKLAVVVVAIAIAAAGDDLSPPLGRGRRDSYHYHHYYRKD